MSISHWGMFFGFMTAEPHPFLPNVWQAVYRPCSPDDMVGSW
jgi:hypothetical protein